MPVMTYTCRATVVFAILIASVLTPHAFAQAYPTKPIRFVIPSPPGGGTDTLARLFKDGLTETFGQPVVPDNRGGASGRIAAAAVAKANPDGHTLLFTYGGVLTTGLPLFRTLPYHPVKDFAPVAMIAHVPGILVAHPSSPAKSVGEIISMARAKPGALTHGASSRGSSSHLNMELFKQMAGIKMLGVAYPGDAPALVALLGGHVPFAFANAVVVLPHIQSGKLRALGVATAQRVPQLPDVPTIAESGLTGYEGLLFYALVAPAKTPPAIVNTLHKAVNQIKHSPAVKQQMATLGAVSIDMTPNELGAFIARELDKWTRVIETGGITAD
ncbi:MAG TPA: tripartite tricarboxylate transporter substrate binding protein [Burkholderiales bacterium]|nr:tripartite tricarboxylate transporter substrate binding protein [Burkholderiales bacterium]